jgi:nicotinamidase/pyrazinamidase
MRTLFVDVDTQIDFLFPAGALYVPGAEEVIPKVAALNRYAQAHRIPLISTMDAHEENDPEFTRWPAHCVAGTVGQLKPEATLLSERAVVPSRRTDVRVDAPQIIVEKLHNHAFTNPNLPALLDAIGAERCVVYGVVTEICVRHAAFGLLERGHGVELVSDAVRSLNDEEASAMLREFASAGGRVISAAEILN